MIDLFPTRLTRPLNALRRTALTLAAMAGLSMATSAHAQLVLDDFSSATPAATLTWHAGTGSTTLNQASLALPVPMGARDVYMHVYANPLNSMSALVAGEGRLSVAQGTQAMAEILVSYGAFTRVGGDVTAGGPLLGLDLSTLNTLRFHFSGAEHGMNVNVVYFTSEPLDPANPLHYASGGINVDPSEPGGPLTFTLPVSNDPKFNWTKVDGVLVLINRSGPVPHTSYTLNKLVFEP